MTPAQAAPDDTADEACLEDIKYLVRAHRGNLAETASGLAAWMRSDDRQVRHLAGMLVHDHTRADMRVVATAERHDVDLPPKPTRQQRADLAAVVAKTGREFDTAWLVLQTKAHETTLTYIGRVLDDGCADDVADLAEGTKKAVERHLALARKALDDRAE